MIKLQQFTFNPFQENTYLLSDASGKCIIIDPGMSNKEEQEEVMQYLTNNKLTPEAIVNTHCHADHVLGCRFMADHYKLPFFFHAEESSLLQHVEEYGALFGLQVAPPPAAERYLEDGELFSFGESELKAFLVPGHSAGSLAFYSKADQFVLTGDVLFRSSIGRADLPGGDYDTLIQSIQNKLLTLPRETKVFPGHGPSSTIGAEHDTNPFLN